MKRQVEALTARFRRLCLFGIIWGLAPILTDCEYFIDTREMTAQDCYSHLIGAVVSFRLAEDPTRAQDSRDLMRLNGISLLASTANCLDKVDDQAKPIYK